MTSGRGLLVIPVIIHMSFGGAVGKGRRKIRIVAVHIGRIAHMSVRPRDIHAAAVAGIRHAVRPDVPERGPDRRPSLIRIRRTADGVRVHDGRRGLLDLIGLCRGVVAPFGRIIAADVEKAHAVAQFGVVLVVFGIFQEVFSPNRARRKSGASCRRKDCRWTHSCRLSADRPKPLCRPPRWKGWRKAGNSPDCR